MHKRGPDGKPEDGRIDLYKRDHFILEAKQSRQSGGKKAIPEGQADLFTAAIFANNALDNLMIQARRQAERYAAWLPADHTYPPFLIVCDVGRTIELYADFSGHGRQYAQFPDARNYRISLEQLADPNIRERLRKVWEAPYSLDPARLTAKVTREILQSSAVVVFSAIKADCQFSP